MALLLPLPVRFLLIHSSTTISDSLTRLGRKKKPRCRALHWWQRNGRKSDRGRSVHFSTLQRWERTISLLSQSGHSLAPGQREMACVLDRSSNLPSSDWKHSSFCFLPSPSHPFQNYDFHSITVSPKSFVGSAPINHCFCPPARLSYNSK